MPKLRFLLLLAALGGTATAAIAQQPPAGGVANVANDWPTWGYDEERSGWNRGETTISKDNVGQLKVQWNTRLSTEPHDRVLSTLTAPVVVAGVETAQGSKDLLFVLGADDQLYAIDARSGTILWQKSYPNRFTAKNQTDWLCPNTSNATPVVDKARGLLFFLPSDGHLRAVSLADGTERMAATEMVPPFTRAWSLNLFDDVVYTTSGRACGEVQDPRSMFGSAAAPPPRIAGQPPVMIDPSAVTAVDVRDLEKPGVSHFFTSGGRPAGPWGRGALARGPGNTLILQTSDGLYDPGSGNWGDTILKLTPRAARVADSFTPENHQYIFSKDLGGSASPVVFPFGDKTLVAQAQKEGFLYLLDANDMGGGKATQHARPLFKSSQLGNDAALGTDPGQGVWGSITTYANGSGQRFLYVPMWGPPSEHAPTFPVSAGPTPNGSVMAFEVVNEGENIVARPRWMSPNLVMPDPPSIANGIVFATSTGGQAMQNFGPDGRRMNNKSDESARFRATPVGNLVLYAFDAETGKQLYSSGDAIPNWVHFSQPVVALGKVFLVTHDAQVYAFGVNQ